MNTKDKIVTRPASRRDVLRALGVAGLATVGGAIVSQPAMAEVTIPATTTQKCGTCRFWGGIRSVSEDRKTVIASGKGTCNNPKSPAYQKQTRPDQGAPVWERWEALG
ncbi:Tat (twin-arginine translocation) pathway signal sequence [Tistlia consotensis]|uniref:Tat (Twin-arginine translocation) pathway signal sequence n=1 Tax=Tistlia consotensis USBA 355 TaxID=560819 RepID=A0A1Y6CRA2_9PROT|nr:twin-arginine translocation signal domain-containing protein [Tistlia consotensis]SMF84721.1 Tat (twin-arginine translocation) pathway signal sequence [Tistlia consotensis USBA 355]SNS38337.1 Tat (twin-arginine translocation) pathway signal sequence [Tistlia consotensis]